MKKPPIFLQTLSANQREFLNLLDLTAKVHGELRSKDAEPKVLWDESFFHLKNSSAWRKISPADREKILRELSEKILQEAFFIESAGMAYAGKMNLAATTKEEREFFCFVAKEEASHLRLIQSLAPFEKSLENIPSFSLLIGEIIQEASKPCHLLLIQILLEGWGLSYYKSLAKSAQDENVVQAFKTILKDEIRHHSAGLILFSQQREEMDAEEISEFLSYLERLAFMVKIGPYTACEAIFRQTVTGTQKDLEIFLQETNAVVVTSGKMEVLHQLISKSLPDKVLKEIEDRKILAPLDLSAMTETLFLSLPEIFSPNLDQK